MGGTTIRTRAPVVDRQRDGAGALLRRGLAVLSANSFLQIFAASLLAGLVGAVAVCLQLSSTLRLAALGLLLVLVPGPAILNGVFDLAVFRLPLGAARLYATLIGLAALFVFPVFWLVTGSFKPAADTIANPPLIWPQTWTLDNFTQVFTTVPFGRWVFNTTLVAASVTGVALLFHSMACAGSYIEDRSHDDGENAVLAAAETAQGRLSPIVAGRHESGPYGVALTTDHEPRRPPTPGSLPYRLAS